MKRRMIIALAFLSTPFVFSKVFDAHLPSSEEFQIQEMREKNRNIQEAWETFHDEKSTDEEKIKAYNTLLDNGAMA